MKHRWLYILIGLAACEDTLTGQKPVGGSVDTEAEIQRYVRRAYLDLSGHVPTDSELTTATTRLTDQGNTPTARGALVDELMTGQTFAKVWVEELENGIFGGNTTDTQYALLCGIVRGDAACVSCTATDSCLCTCPQIQALNTERTLLRKSATDFAAGTKSSVLERRYAEAVGYFALSGTPEARVRNLFDDFLARPAEGDEVENGRAMIFGSIIPGSPAGLLFHKHGGSYMDMLDIIFASEPYREALVRRVFQRYLAREPGSLEMAHFTSTLDAATPDVRGLVRSVVTSREYFEQ